MTTPCRLFTFCPAPLLPTSHIRKPNNPICCSTSKINETQVTSKKTITTFSKNSPTKYIWEVSKGEEFLGTVVNVGPAESSWIDIGVATKRGKPVRGRLRLSQLRPGTHPEPAGSAVLVHVHKVDHAAARVEVRRGLKLNREKSELTVNDGKMMDALKIGDKLEGKVVGLGQYGAVIDANVIRYGKRNKLVKCNGLLPRDYFKEEWNSEVDPSIRSDVEKIIKVDDILTLWVRAVRPQNAFLLFDSNLISEEELDKRWEERRKRRKKLLKRPTPETLNIGEERFGVVVKMVTYGAFVDIGVRTNGLLHYSKMGEENKYNWREKLTLGSEVIVQVEQYENKRLALGLVSFGDEVLVDAKERAESATARIDDVKRAEFLQQKAAFMELSRYNIPSDAVQDDIQVETSETYPLNKDSQIKQKVEMIENDDDEEAESDEEEEDKQDDDPDPFSDEYFEDKYGF